jgi:hypothetical protein
VEELKEILEHLRADYNRKVQDIDNLESLSLADSTRSLASKTHKYPDVICPHFKNGGKCKHCINKWKESQKMEN